jgi:citrate lyase subunit beta/citryl-CoA lyase
MNTENYIMRSLMFVPGHNEKLIQSASQSDADVILLDVEDSVMPVANKQLAREIIKKHVQLKTFSNFKVYVRINEIGSGYLLQDIIQLTIDGIDGFLCSKTNTANDIVFLDKLLEVIEIERGYEVGKFKIIPILETAASIVNANEIAQSSNRIVAIGFGSEDFVSDLEGIRDFDTNTSLFTPRAWVAMVARTHNLIPIDAAYIKVHDLVGLEAHLKVGRTLGYAGMWVLHPKQNELTNQYYAPSEEEINEAHEIIKLADEAIIMNKGVAIINGKFIGPPLVVKANRIIKRAKLIEAQKRKKLKNNS